MTYYFNKKTQKPTSAAISWLFVATGLSETVAFSLISLLYKLSVFLKLAVSHSLRSRPTSWLHAENSFSKSKLYSMFGLARSRLFKDLVRFDSVGLLLAFRPNDANDEVRLFELVVLLFLSLIKSSLFWMISMCLNKSWISKWVEIKIRTYIKYKIRVVMQN